MTSTRVLFAAAFVMLFWQLMCPPVIGVANNGDFSRTYGIFHLTMPIPDEVRFSDTHYQFDPQLNYFGGFYSSEIALVPPALALNAIFSKDGTFDVRFTGFIHGVLFLTALCLFLPLLRDLPVFQRWLTGGLAVFFFGDVMYVAYLNSFYTDVAAYVFLLLTVVLALRAIRWGKRLDWILFTVASLFLVTSKAQHAALGLWIAGFVWLIARKQARWMAAVIALVSVGWLAESTPAAYSARGCFSTIFFHLLPHSPNQDKTLADLGLDQSYRPYIGMVSFSPGSPMDDSRFVAEFRKRITYGSLAVFLLTHPRDTYVAVRSSLDDAGRQRPPLGNFDPSAGLAPGAQSQAFAFWSNFKRMLFNRRGSRYLTYFFCVMATMALLLFVQRRSLPAGGMAGGFILIGMAATELAVSSLADAMEIARHHLLFYAHFDMLLILGVWLLGRLVSYSTK